MKKVVIPMTPLLILCLLGLIIPTASSAVASSNPGCSKPQAQQMFDWPRYGPNGCIKLASIVNIFGDSQQPGAKITATRFLTANLVFTGLVTHVVKDANAPEGTVYRIRVRVNCYLKGRLARSEIELSGFETNANTSLCLSIACQDGDQGLFFATYTPNGRVLINENGFVREGPAMEKAIRALACRQNHAEIGFWPVQSSGQGAAAPAAPFCRRIDPEAAPTCEMSLDTARRYLDLAFINYERDLKRDCQLGKDAVLRKLLLPPVSPAVALMQLSSYGNGASTSAGKPTMLKVLLAAATTASILMVLRR